MRLHLTEGREGQATHPFYRISHCSCPIPLPQNPSIPVTFQHSGRQQPILLASDYSSYLLGVHLESHHEEASLVL